MQKLHVYKIFKLLKGLMEHMVDTLKLPPMYAEQFERHSKATGSRIQQL